MKFSVREDIEAPIEFVFAQMTDFKALERAAMRRGAEVQRVDTNTQVGPGMAWDASFKLRGRQRDVQIEITELDTPNRLVLSSRSPAMGGKMVVELIALSRARTRAIMDVDLQPKNLSAKLLVQSMRLARKNLNKRLKDRVKGYAEEIASKYRRAS